MDVVPVPQPPLLGQQVVVHHQLIVLAVDGQDAPVTWPIWPITSPSLPVSILPMGVRLCTRPSGGRMSVVNTLMLGNPALMSSL